MMRTLKTEVDKRRQEVRALKRENAQKNVDLEAVSSRHYGPFLVANQSICR